MARRHVCDSTGGPSQHHFLLCTAFHCVKAAHGIRHSTQTGSLPRRLLLRVVLLTAFSYVTSGEETRALPLGVYLSTGRTGSTLADIFQRCSRAAVPVPTAINSVTFPVAPTPADAMLPQVVVTLVGMRGAVTQHHGLTLPASNGMC